MSNPAVAPREPYVLNADFPPDPFLEFLGTREWRERLALGQTVPEVTRLLSGLDIIMRPSFSIPREYTVSPEAFQSTRPFLAMAKKGKIAPRISSGDAYRLLTRVWRLLPAEHREEVAARVRDVVYVDGGAEFSLGRLAAHAPRTVLTTSLMPPTADETELALVRNGVDLLALPAHAYRAYPLIPRTEGERTVYSNTKASMGFPVLGKGDNEEGIAKVNRLAVAVREEIRSVATAPGGVWGWLRKAEDERPWLVSLQGKAKADYYKSAKIEGHQLRFYNTYGKQMMLNMQVATQALEGCKRNIFTDSRARSTLGTSLVRGGANELVAALSKQLEEGDFAYAHCGDDSWVIYRDGQGVLHVFALDCTSFDLTQHGSVTAPIHQRLRQQLRFVDLPAADLWYAYVRERQVVVALRHTIKTRHWGPSGTPLQSLVNGILMDVALQRTGQRLARVAKDGLTPDSIAAALFHVGRELGLKIRLEQHRAGQPGQSLRSMLEQEPFLFIGYNFYQDWDGVAKVYCDLPRQCAQMRFPGLKWLRKGQEVKVMEAMRLGSIMLNWGVPPAPLRPAFEAGRAEARRLLEECLAKYGDSSDPKLRWAVSESPFGPATIGSLSGLLEVLRKPAEELWLRAPEELPGVSEWVMADEPSAWADQVDAEEREERRRLGVPELPAPGDLPQALQLRRFAFPTHPVTSSNFGLNPPTAVWLPDKPKRTRVVRGSTRVARFAAVLDTEQERWERWAQEQGYDEDDESLYSRSTRESMTLEEYEDWRNDQAWMGAL